MEKKDELRLAILIDADNVPSSNIKGMIEEVAKYGNPTFKRIYGDWTKPTVARWKTLLLENAITPIQQYSYTTGKNSTDSAMIIDAMDILYTGRVDGFCLVSSDSDFTRLATRLREAGMKVIGMGEKKTPAPFISACDKFIYVEILDVTVEEENGEGKKKAPHQKAATIQKLNKEIIHLMETTVNDVADESGWAFLGEVGALLLKKQPDFDPRNYGYRKLLPLIKSTGRFEVDARQTDRGNIKLVYVKAKR
ncbi:MAG: NYN domain-containing protein [Chitinophagaceae bacterium]|nr:NYN domain-containing protein [Chitinophagaceae bacterium]